MGILWLGRYCWMLNFQVLCSSCHREEIDLVFLDSSNCLLLFLSCFLQCLTLFPQYLILPFRIWIILLLNILMSTLFVYLPFEIIFIVKCLSRSRHHSYHWISLSRLWIWLMLCLTRWGFWILSFIAFIPGKWQHKVNVMGDLCSARNLLGDWKGKVSRDTRLKEVGSRIHGLTGTRIE